MDRPNKPKPDRDELFETYDVRPMEEELVKIEGNPEWGQGPGTEYHAEVQRILRANYAEWAAGTTQPKDWA